MFIFYNMFNIILFFYNYFFNISYIFNICI